MDFKPPFVSLNPCVLPLISNPRWGLPSGVSFARPCRDNVDIVYIAFVRSYVADAYKVSDQEDRWGADNPGT
jgi:hypothetical protein